MTDPYTDPGERTGMPRWLTLSAVVGLLVAVLVLVIVLVRGGHRIPNHGPGNAPATSGPAAPHVRPPH